MARSELTVDVCYDCGNEWAPGRAQIESWVIAALRGEAMPAEVSVRIVDEPEARQFNSRYRQRDCATNVLSFPADISPEVGVRLLGDLLLCAPVIIAQAREQKKNLADHWAHLIIHGVLHLTGMEHEEEVDAAVMEAREIGVLKALGIGNPYT